MSGIYLIVWDNASKAQSPILKSTKGGYPHITLAYTGKHVDTLGLCSTSTGLFDKCVMREVTCVGAQVNSFEERPGKMRHDVLILLSQGDTVWVETLRREHLMTYSNWPEFSMRSPHITHGIYETVEEAGKVATALNAAYLPTRVTITGITID